ncbi:class V aminotransferase [Achlya hypogyna]|uniref:Class V aminotransferase n=1 Tax=Achlya hypogyna TaxID=1202772 RepID=A0A1V9YME9_ACHHY|nr:class V aminotransferase [Achlya hypogyna]
MTLPPEVVLARLCASEIGNLASITTPFGPRKLVYADYVASGRSVDFIEAAIARKVLPFYANTHTETSHCGQQMNQWRAEARDYIASQVGARLSQDVVFFTGAGCTGAIQLLVGRLRRLYRLQHAVVFMGPYEHHSNDLAWRETGAKIVRIRPGTHGGVDLGHLEAKLRRHRRRALLIGTFSVASNITGITTDPVPVTRLLKAYGALAFWDYAAGAPYMHIDMHEGGVSKDAIFFSPHKFLGGPGTPGILVANRSLFSTEASLSVEPSPRADKDNESSVASENLDSSSGSEGSDGGMPPPVFIRPTLIHGIRETLAKKSAKMNDVPVNPGGGTVLLVSRRTHQYVDDIAEREEGGTPDIVGALRAAMVFQLKASLGHAFLRAQEAAVATRMYTALQAHPNVVVLGDPAAPRLPTFSFLIRHDTLFLHPQFVSRLLSDLFGIQTRSGCACAGPYGALLFQIPDDLALVVFSLLQRKALFMKPGFTRFNVPVFWSAARENFVVDAVHFIAEHGWRFVPLYDQCLASGVYTYRGSVKVVTTPFADLLADVAALEPPAVSPAPSVDEAHEYSAVLAEAHAILTKLVAEPTSVYQLPPSDMLIDPVEVLKDLAQCKDPKMRHFCWYVTTPDVLRRVSYGTVPDRCSVFRPLFSDAVAQWPPALSAKELKALNINYMESNKVHSIYGSRIVQKLMGFK